jgi:hypothetical protein
MIIGVSMLLTNVADFMLDSHGKVRQDIGFHIPNHQLYKSLGFPYYFRDEDFAIVDSYGNLAVMTLELIDSLDWEVSDGRQSKTT